MSLKKIRYGARIILAVAVLFVMVPVLAQSLDSSQHHSPLLYPNPANDYIRVNLDSEIKTIDIYSLLGQKLSSHNVRENNKIFVGELPNGIYLARLFDLNGKQIKTIRIQKN